MFGNSSDKVQMPATRNKLYHAQLSNGPRRPRTARARNADVSIYKGGKSEFVDSVIQNVLNTPRKAAVVEENVAPVAAPAPVPALQELKKNTQQKQRIRPQTARVRRGGMKKAAPSVGSSFLDSPRSGFYTGQMSYRTYGSVAREHHKQLKTKKQLWAQYTFLHGKQPPRRQQKMTPVAAPLVVKNDNALEVVGTSLVSPTEAARRAALKQKLAEDFSNDDVVLRAQEKLAAEEAALGIAAVDGTSADATTEQRQAEQALVEEDNAAIVLPQEDEPVVVEEQQPQQEVKVVDDGIFHYEYPEWRHNDEDMQWPPQSTYDAGAEIKNRPATAPASCEPANYAAFYPPNADVPPNHQCAESSRCTIWNRCMFLP